MTLNQELRCENIKFSILRFETMMYACVLTYIFNFQLTLYDNNGYLTNGL